MKRSTYNIVLVEDDRVFIVDRDQGKSVTNDAENVWRDIQAQWPGRRLIYRDTMGRWDEIVGSVDDHRFVTVQFRPYSEHVPLTSIV